MKEGHQDHDITNYLASLFPPTESPILEFSEYNATRRDPLQPTANGERPRDGPLAHGRRVRLEKGPDRHLPLGAPQPRPRPFCPRGAPAHRSPRLRPTTSPGPSLLSALPVDPVSPSPRRLHLAGRGLGGDQRLFVQARRPAIERASLAPSVVTDATSGGSSSPTRSAPDERRKAQRKPSPPRGVAGGDSADVAEATAPQVGR